jgi:ABC-type ATPase with predicted acetyltransferase domain
MGVYKCTDCGTVRESRCKPKKCKECGGNEFERQDSTCKNETASRSKCKR